MLNLLRMDLYRLARSKCVYICLAILIAISILCFGLIWMLATPEGRNAAAQIGMTATENGFTLSTSVSEPAEEGSILPNYNILHMFREIAMDGGGYTCILGIVISIFVCHDYNSGFIKNILSLHRQRWKYILSKILAAGILNLVYLGISFSCCLLLNGLFGGLVPLAPAADILLYISLSWLLTTAFAALFILIITLSRSTSAGILSTLLLGSGIAVSVLVTCTRYWGFQNWINYTLYVNQTNAPSCYSSTVDLKGYAVGAVFLILYSAAAMGILKHKDV